MSAGSERSYAAYATPAAVLADFSRGSGPSVSGGGSGRSQAEGGARRKPPFRPAADDTKPVLRDPHQQEVDLDLIIAKILELGKWCCAARAFV